MKVREVKVSRKEREEWERERKEWRDGGLEDGKKKETRERGKE